MTCQGSGSTGVKTGNWLFENWAKTGRRVTGTTRLFGGLTSEVSAVTLDDGESLVLRRYTGGGREAADCIEHEAATLTKLTGTGVLAPQLVGLRERRADVPYRIGFAHRALAWRVLGAGY